MKKKERKVLRTRERKGRSGCWVGREMGYIGGSNGKGVAGWKREGETEEWRKREQDVRGKDKGGIEINHNVHAA